MAVQAAVFPPADNTISAEILTTATTAAVEIPSGILFAIQASDDVHIVFGLAGVAAPDVASWPIYSGSIQTFQMPVWCTHVRLYNPTGSTVRYHILPLGRN